jgi:hypothetical protein
VAVIISHEMLDRAPRPASVTSSPPSISPYKQRARRRSQRRLIERRCSLVAIVVFTSLVRFQVATWRRAAALLRDDE